MESNTVRPDWLTDEVIEEMRHNIQTCSNPYTQEDISNWEYDGEYNQHKLNAYDAIRILNKYGIPLTKE